MAAEYAQSDVPGRKMFWDAQMWVCAQRMGLSILEIPVSWAEGDKSALRVRTELPMAAFTLRHWAARRWRRVDAPTASGHWAAS